MLRFYYLEVQGLTGNILGPGLSFDNVSRAAVGFSTMIIFSTIHAQDFSDVEGDAADGRITFPMYAPEVSRLLILLVIPLWSVGLSLYWGLGQFSTSAISLFGILIGLRFYQLRSARSDRSSYVLFNVSLYCVLVLLVNGGCLTLCTRQIWLSMVALLPLNARLGVFSL